MNNLIKSLELDLIINKMASYSEFSLGKEALLNIRPSFKKLEIIRDNKRIGEALSCVYKYSSMPFNGIRDIKNALIMIEKGKTGTIQDCLNVASHFSGVNDIYNFYKDKKEFENILELVDSLYLDMKLKTYIDSCIDDYGQIKDSASEAIMSIKKQLLNNEKEMASLIERYKREKSSIMVDNIVSIRNDRVVILAKVQEKNKIKGLVYGESNSGQAVYVEPPEFIRLNNKKSSLLSMLEEEIERILRDISDRIRPCVSFILANLETLALLDSLFARAKWGKENDACVASLGDDFKLLIDRVKHPLIDKDKVVSNSYKIEDPYRVLLITGPNTGGKTVSLKVLGLMVLMTYCGMPLTCEKAYIPFFDGVYIDIGDNQSVVESLSTFSAHLSNLAKIIERTTCKSLVLLDELGSGTDPKEGESLAISLLDELRSRRCMLAATTHFAKLKAYGKKYPDILVAMVEFDVEKLVPTYRFIEGSTGQSNAFDIALRYGLDKRIVENAIKIKKEGTSKEEDLIEKLEIQLQKNRLLEEELEIKIKENIQKNDELNKLKIDLDAKKEALLLEAKEEARTYFIEKQEEADEIISRLKGKMNIKYHEALNIKKELDLVEEESVINDEDFRVNDTVVLLKSNQVGKIISINKKQVVIDVRGITIKAKTSDIKKTDRKIEKKSLPSVKSHNFTSAKTECNLIGMRVEEALNDLDKFMDTALLNRLVYVRIIHGDGSGTLRKAVHKYLSENSRVKDFRLGMPNEGGTGATLVTLKN